MSKIHSSKRVILCRGIADNNDTHNDYVETFEKAGYNCHNLATLRFEFVKLEQLKNCLLLPNSYGGLIVTSRRSVEAIDRALQGKDLPEQWKNLPAYCVGRATESLVRSILKLNRCLCPERENARDLANYIVEDSTRNSGTLLYPCSSIARDTIERVLDDNDVSVQKITVYDTLPAETLENDLRLVIDDTVQIFVFFSPSTVEYILNAAGRENRILERIKAVAIGPASAEALVKAGMTVQAVSTKPEPKSLLQAVQLAGL